MRRDWYYRILWSYLPVFVVVVSFLFFLYFNLLNVQNKKQAIHANTIVAGQMMRMIDAQLKIIDDTMINEIWNDPIVMNYFYQDEPGNPYLHYQVVKLLNTLILNNKLIHSLYLVNLRGDFVLTANTMSPLDSFGDAAFIGSAMNGAAPLTWSERRDYQEFSRLTPDHVFTLVKDVKLIRNQRGLLVVNVDPNAVFDLVRTMYSQEVSNVSLADNNNNILFGEQSPFPEITHIKSSYTGWTLSMGLKSELFADAGSFFFSVLTIVGLLAVLLGIGWIVYITKRNYKPVQLLVSRIQTYSLTKSAQLGGMNEFQFIESAIDNIVAQSNRFQERHVTDINLKKKHVFYEWIEGSLQPSSEEWKSAVDEMHISLMSTGDLQALVLEIDNFHAFCREFSESERNVLKFAMQSAVSELSASSGRSVWPEWTSDKHMSLVLQADDGENKETVAEFCVIVSNWIKKNLRYTVTIGLGDPVTEPGLVSMSHKTALACLELKPAFGGGRLITYKETMEEIKQNDMFPHFENVRLMVHAFMRTNHWQEMHHELFARARRDRLNRYDAESLLKYIISCLDREIKAYADDYVAIWKKEALPKLGEQLEMFDNLPASEPAFGEILKDLARQIARIRGQRGHYIAIRQAKAYIEANFTNPDISLIDVGTRVGMNEKQLSKLFKEELGENYIDFLIHLRIDHAKHLLAASDRPIDEIAARVGYASATPFRRVFKKMAGVSPGDYRKKIDSQVRAVSDVCSKDAAIGEGR